MVRVFTEGEDKPIIGFMEIGEDGYITVKEIDEELLKEDKKMNDIEILEELKNADLTTVYINEFYDGEKKVKDKIKAKIEELKQDEDFYREQDRMYEYEGKLNLLQSLLEKE